MPTIPAVFVLTSLCGRRIVLRTRRCRRDATPKPAPDHINAPWIERARTWLAGILPDFGYFPTINQSTQATAARTVSEGGSTDATDAHGD